MVTCNNSELDIVTQIELKTMTMGYTIDIHCRDQTPITKQLPPKLLTN